MPSPSPHLGRTRSHSSSLSIARSPNVLASAHFLPPISPISPHDLDQPNPIESHHPLAQNWRANILGRSVSASRMGRLEAITSVEDLSASTTAGALLDPEDKTGDYAEDDYDGSASTPLLKPHTHSSNADGSVFDRLSVDLNGIERLEGPAFEYTGPFQPPDSKELLGIILSFLGVLVLAVAAGLATIFDWVL
ncbi:hypothetical protein J008_04842 [Cryptococcus neoformans]|nr:hypothetical protein J008_04842 [Cryptococcus neoformans var. grubii]